MGYERPNVAAMQGYVPGKQPASSETIKLNTNENPYPPSAAVMEALRAVPAEALRRYPPPSADALRDVVAELHGLTREHVVAVNGGDELLRMAIATFVEPGMPIGTVEPSYSLYPVLAQAHGSPIVSAPASTDFAPPSGTAELMNRAGVQLLFLVNPHAPSGQLLPAAKVAELASTFRGVLLVDEAYVDFVDPELDHDAVSLVRRHDNLLVLRTLSKGYGLAGLRLGYGLGAPSLISPLLWKTRDSYNVDAIAQRLAVAALRHRDDAARTWAKVRSERARLTGALRALGLTVPASQTNFVLATVPAGLSANDLQQQIERKGVLVRHFDAEGLRDKLRITVGTPEQDDALLQALDELL